MEIPDQESRGHLQKTSLYIWIGLILILLTGFTYGASYINWGQIIGGGFLINILVALIIASLKAFCVLHFFMHVRFETSLIRFLGIIYPIIIFLILVFFLFIDVFLRNIPTPT